MITPKSPDIVPEASFSRENTVLRGELFEPSPEDRRKLTVRDNIYVIPNALVAERFQPDPKDASNSSSSFYVVYLTLSHQRLSVTIVVISRLAYRKGVDLLVAAAPRICEAFPSVNFLVGGSGPKLIDLLRMREKHQLQDRIQLLGSVEPSDVRSVLVKGSIFLNTSLTESFGIAIVEAACAGLYVVSTKVGGVPEILPHDMISFANPDEDGEHISIHYVISSEHNTFSTDVFRAVSEAVDIVSKGQHDPWKAHGRIKEFYDWSKVCIRTEKVYDTVIRSPQMDMMRRIQRYTAQSLLRRLLIDMVLLELWA